jgi:hypothetical protein
MSWSVTSDAREKVLDLPAVTLPEYTGVMRNVGVTVRSAVWPCATWV